MSWQGNKEATYLAERDHVRYASAKGFFSATNSNMTCSIFETNTLPQFQLATMRFDIISTSIKQYVFEIM